MAGNSPLTNSDGLISANSTLLTQIRRLPVAASVRMVSMSRSDSPERPLACRNSTFVCRKCLLLVDVIVPMFPTRMGGRLQRPPNIDRTAPPRQKLDLHDLDAFRYLTVPGVYGLPADGYVFVAEWIQGVFAIRLVKHALELCFAVRQREPAFPHRPPIIDRFQPPLQRRDGGPRKPDVGLRRCGAVRADPVDLAAEESVHRQFRVMVLHENHVGRVERLHNPVKGPRQAPIAQEHLIIAAIDAAGASAEEFDGRAAARSVRPL